MSAYIDFQAVAEELLDAHPASNVYFLLDHGGLPGLHKQLLRSSAEWVSLFDCTKESDALAVAPILIWAGSTRTLRISKTLCEWIGKHGTYTSSVILLSSPLSIEIMRGRLSARLDARLPENMEAMLRFFDSRIIESLGGVLSAEQKKEFFGLAEEWRYVDREGRVIAVESYFSPQENFIAPLVLSQQQESALLSASEIDQVLDLLRSNVPQAMAPLSMPEQYRFVCRHAVQAKQKKFESIWEVAFYATVILSKGERFAESENWPRILEHLKRNEFDLSEMI